VVVINRCSGSSTSKRDKEAIPAVVKTIEYDPGRTAHGLRWFVIMMVRSVISLAPHGLKGRPDRGIRKRKFP